MGYSKEFEQMLMGYTKKKKKDEDIAPVLTNSDFENGDYSPEFKKVLMGEASPISTIRDTGVGGKTLLESLFGEKTVQDAPIGMDRRTGMEFDSALSSTYDALVAKQNAGEDFAEELKAYQTAYDDYYGYFSDENLDRLLKEAQKQRDAKAKDPEWLKAAVALEQNLYSPDAFQYKEAVDKHQKELDEIKAWEQTLRQDKQSAKYIQYMTLAGKEDFAEYSAKATPMNDFVREMEGVEGAERKDAVSNLSEDELSVYNYLYNKEGRKKADEFYEFLKGYDLNRRQAVAKAKHIQDMGFLGETTMSVGTNFGAGVQDWAGGMKSLFTGDPAEQSASQIAAAILTEEAGPVASKVYGASRTVGNMAPSILLSKGLGTVSGALGASANVASKIGQTAGAVSMGTSAAGNAYSQKIAEGWEENEARTYGLLVGASEVATERIFNGIPGLGGAIDADDFVRTLNGSFSRLVAGGVINMAGEVAEEELQLLLEPAIEKMVVGGEYKTPTGKEALDTALVTMLSTGAMNAPRAIGLEINYNKYGKMVQQQHGWKELADRAQKLGAGTTSAKIAEKISAEPYNVSYSDIGRLYTQMHQDGIFEKLTENEQKVVDALFAKETKGKKLSKKEQEKLRKEIVRYMDEGNITADYIESVLGGDEYTAFQETLKSENEALKELSELYKGKGKELKAEVEKFIENSESKKLKAQLRENVSGMVKGERLYESYREIGRATQKFTADVSKYNKKYRAAIQRAIDSGSVNNSRYAHRMVETVAKFEAHLGAEFDFSNTKKINEAGYGIEGKITDGYVDENGNITINMQSPKVWNFIVGHEITHLAQDTKFGDKLNEVLFEYAKGRKAKDSKFKNEYMERLYDARQRYKNIKSYQGTKGLQKIRREVAADLVGDYLFNDREFVDHLAKHRNLFQWLWNDVRRMANIMTAGSEEAKQLERIKKTFEDAYRKAGKGVSANGEVQHSITLGKNADISIDVNKAVETFGITKYNDYIGVQKTVFERLLDDGFFDRNTKRRVIENADTGISVEIGWRGIKETFGKGKNYQYLPAELKKLKIATVRHLPDIIRYGEVVESGVDEYHKNNPDLKYTYIQHPITVDGKTMYVVVDIRQSKQTDMFWMHGVYVDKKIAKSLVTSTEESGQAVNKDLTTGDTVPHSGNGVKGTFSVSDSDYMDAVNRGKKKKAQQMVDEAAVEAGVETGPDGKPIALYHGTPNFGFTTIDTKFSDDSLTFWATAEVSVAESYLRSDFDPKHKEARREIGNPQTESNDAKLDRKKHSEEAIVAAASVLYPEYKKAVHTDEEKLRVTRKDVKRAKKYGKELISSGVFTGENLQTLERFVDAVDAKTLENLANATKDVTLGLKDLRQEVEWNEKYDDLLEKFIDTVSDIEPFTKPGWIDSIGNAINIDKLVQNYNRNEGVYKLYYKAQTPFVLDCKGRAWNKISAPATMQAASSTVTTRDVARWAYERGYDSVKFENTVDMGSKNAKRTPATVWCFMNPKEQLWSADPVTYDNAGNVIPLSERFNSEKDDIRYSVSDSEGVELSKEQQAYFKDSKMRDENGNLKVMYHGTPNGDYTVFKDGTYFTDNKEYADRYQNPSASSISTGKVASNPKTFEVYLNIEKPFDISDAEARKIYIEDYIKGGNAIGINPYLPDAEYDKISTIDWTEGEDLRDFLMENGYDYDGLVLDEGADGGYGEDVQSRGKSYVVFNPEQAKDIHNENPTDNPDIRYSISEEGETAELPIRGDFNVPTKYLAYDPDAEPDIGFAPVRKDVGTVAENATVEDVAPVKNVDEPVDTTEGETRVEEIASTLNEGKRKVDGYTVYINRDSQSSGATITIKKADGENIKQRIDGGRYWTNDSLHREAATMIAEDEGFDVSSADPDSTIATTMERLEAKKTNSMTELGTVKQKRSAAYQSLSEKIEKVQAQYDGKKNKDTKVANNLLRRIERLKRIRADVDADFAKRISDIEGRIGKVDAAMQEDHTKADRLERAFARIDRHLEQDKADLEQEFNQRREELADRNAYIADNAMRLYKEIRNLKKGVRASEQLGYLLDSGHDWSSIKSALVNISHTPGKTVNINSQAEALAREMLGRDYDEQAEGLDGEYAKRVAELESEAQKLRDEAVEAERRLTRKDLHQSIVDKISARFAEKGLDFMEALKKAKNLATFRTVDNTPQRVNLKTFGQEAGTILNDVLADQVARDTTEAIKWLNSYTDRKNGVLANLSKKYNIKPGSKENAAAQMYAEGFWVNDANEVIAYGDAELAQDFPDVRVQNNIKALAKDPVIRQIYDETLDSMNEVRTRNAYAPIPRRDNYFLHFREQTDTFSRMGIPFNPEAIKVKDLPTDINGRTADLKPGKPYFASEKQRKGMRTTYDLLGGLERYLTSAANQIYQIDNIQTHRALLNFIADTFGQANGLGDLENLSAADAKDRIEKVFGNHLTNYAKFLNEEANVLAGKTALMDRAIEGMFGRRGLAVFDEIRKNFGAAVISYNVSSAGTNFLPVVTAVAKLPKQDSVKAFAQLISGRFGKLKGKTDAFVENNPTVIRRKGADRFSRKLWDKVKEPGYAMMGAVDAFSTEFIVRAKYNELTRKGMEHDEAVRETDKWASKLMGDRSLGQQPLIFNSRLMGAILQFQLEVRNNLDVMFYDTAQEAKLSVEEKANVKHKNAKAAAKAAAVMFEIALGNHIFGQVFQKVAGYNPAFDIISAIAAAAGWDDEEDSEDTAMDNLEQAFFELMEDMPYYSVLEGGRIPMSTALPIRQIATGKDQYGNEKKWWKTLGETAPYWFVPGYGQAKKTIAGLSMFSDDHPVSGSYTKSGNLRFPVEKTPLNVAQAAIFGQYANKNAREYFDRDLAPLNPKQIEEYQDVDLPISEYWDYRQGLKGLDSLEEKADYIYDLDLPIRKQNLLINNIADRKEDIDLTGYGLYDSLEEFDYANKNPEKYSFLSKNNISYAEWKFFDDDTKDAWNWAFDNPEKMSMAKAISGDVVDYRRLTSELYDIKADKDSSGKTISGSRKQKVLDYINSLDLDYGQKIILFRSLYSSQEDKDMYNGEIIQYLNSRGDISYAEEVEILKELGITVLADGSTYWE